MRLKLIKFVNRVRLRNRVFSAGRRCKRTFTRLGRCGFFLERRRSIEIEVPVFGNEYTWP